MAFTVRDFHDLVELLEKRPEWRADLRRLVLTEDILALPQIVQQLVQTVAELAEAQKRTEAQLAEFQRQAEQRFTRLENALAELVDAQKRTEARMEELAEAQKRMTDRQSSLVGDQLERRYRERAFAYFGRFLRQVQVVSLQELEADLERHLSEVEMEELLLLDVLVRGRPAGQPGAPQVWLALEVSAVHPRADAHTHPHSQLDGASVTSRAPSRYSR